VCVCVCACVCVGAAKKSPTVRDDSEACTSSVCQVVFAYSFRPLRFEAIVQ
jgi:hypothetical protein